MKKWILFIMCLGMMGSSWAFKPFKISDIRVEGLQRIAAGTIFTYIGVKKGEEFNDNKSAQAVRALFKTGFFKDVKLALEGTVVVVMVTERPSIASIEIEGNKSIDDKVLKGNFRRLGFVEGRVFNRSLLDKIEQELRRSFLSQGKYNVRIKTASTPLERNRVAIEITISEGRPAKIKKINVVGNTKFTDKQLLKNFKLTSPKALSFYSKNDQYSKQKLKGDLGKLRSFYLDRGYLDFRLTSTQVSISPDKKGIYITVNIVEGEQYKVDKVKLAGKLVVPVEELQGLINIPIGSIYSLRNATDSKKRITKRLGDEGYAFARIKISTALNRKNSKVTVTIFVDPARRVYVRRIMMIGNLRTSDLVLRREMRQIEGGWYSAKKIKRSRIRLQRLGFFTEVKVGTKPVAGVNDQVDVVFTVKEKPSGNFLASVGFSQTGGILFNTSVQQDNFLGTGRRLGVAVTNSDITTGYRLNYTNPYYTQHGVSRGFVLRTEETDASRANLSNYRTDRTEFSINYGIPINEHDRIRFGLGFKETGVIAGLNSATQISDFIALNGETNQTIELTASYSHDTRNKAVFANRGVLHRISAQVALPSGDLQYFKVRYRHQRFLPISRHFTLFLKGEVGYGDGYDTTTTLPFYENYFSGGVRSVRGFDDNSLGPRDSNDRPIGGAFKVLTSLELIFPPPFATNSKALRVSAFVDAGNVYGDVDDYDSGTLRVSGGLSLIWISPVGPIRLSFAAPIKEFQGDRTQVVQFSLGNAFF
ncbi:Outer membrane protein assembly factor YaeT [hydrothermal vent metagenome]|uniref:Outer membrane protein assembly factor YaeT n=1 Tax=hydrothermal vent metagenome TaxID=652676 RepID=A0A3B0Y1A0_9ZZZZ